jgi:hypothetical protein
MIRQKVGEMLQIRQKIFLLGSRELDKKRGATK